MLHYFKQLFLFAICFSTTLAIHAQEQSHIPTVIAPMELSITNIETSVLIFPEAIKSVDRGSKDILTKVVKDVSNVLKLKAASESISSTNLHVFTADGKVYAFALKYTPQPARLTIDLTNGPNGAANSSPVKFVKDRLNDSEIEQYSERIASMKAIRKRPHSQKKGGSRLSLHGTYLKDGVLFFQLSVTNNAELPYHIDFARTYIRDKRQTKRASVTEKEVQPLYKKMTSDGISTLDHPVNMVLAFDQFTIADGKYFVIEVFEKNGDRVLTCKLKGKHLLMVREPQLTTDQEMVAN